MNPGFAESLADAFEMGREFDQAFEQAARPPESNPQRLLGLHLGPDPYAIRLAEIAGLYCDRRIVPVPAPVPEFLGMAAFRGQPLPVYDLSTLMGYARAAAPRWLIVARQGETVALAFESFDSYLAAAHRQIIAVTDGGVPGSRHISDGLDTDGRVRPIINLASLLVRIGQLAKPVQGRTET